MPSSLLLKSSKKNILSKSRRVGWIKKKKREIKIHISKTPLLVYRKKTEIGLITAHTTAGGQGRKTIFLHFSSGNFSKLVFR